jgi:hypothetical protein
MVNQKLLLWLWIFVEAATAILLTPKKDLSWEKLRTELSSYWNRVRRKDGEETALISRAPQVVAPRVRNTARHRVSSKVCFAFRNNGAVLWF